MRRPLVPLLLAAGMLIGNAPFDAPAVADAELADMRGGFRLPNGIDVALAVRTDTLVDGALVLRSVFLANVGSPTLQVFTGGSADGAEVDDAAVAGGSGSMPDVTYDPRTGQITSAASITRPAVTITSGAGAAVLSRSEGLRELDLTAGPATIPAGDVSLSSRPGGHQVNLTAGDLSVRHFFGDAFGAFTANSGNDRTIDTITTVSIDLSNVTPDALGSSLLRAESLALDATRSLGR